jgi:adenylylsulfate kinase
MLFIQLTGLSGAGKSTIASGTKDKLLAQGLKVEIIDADIYRRVLCNDLGYSTKDRQENIRRLGFVANLLATNGIISILAAINPYEAGRKQLEMYGYYVKTVWVNCDTNVLVQRDTKGLYKKALLPDGHPDKILNLTGINDTYEEPQHPHLIINTHKESIDESISKLSEFITCIIRKNTVVQ